MTQKKSIIVIDPELETEMTLEELCKTFNVTPAFIYEVIEYGVIEPVEPSDEELRFTLEHLKRLRTAIHLQEDLEVNLPGAALVLDLMEELESLREQIRILQQLTKI